MRYKSIIILMFAVILITGCLGSGGVEPFEEIDVEESDYENFVQLEEIDIDEVPDQNVQLAMGETEEEIHVQVINLVPNENYETIVESVYVNDEEELEFVFVSEGDGSEDNQDIVESEITVEVDSTKLGDDIDTITITLNDGWNNLHIEDFER